MSNNGMVSVPLALLKNIEMTWRQASGFSNKANDVIEEGLGQLRAILAAPVVEPQACTSPLMKIAADLANRKPLRQLYQICETQGRISADSLHEHLDKAGDLLAGVALDIRRAIAKPQHQGEPSHWADSQGNTITAALKAARQFIVNGTELGYIRMPEAETPDPAHDTLPMIERAIAELEALADESARHGAAVTGEIAGGDVSHNTVTVHVNGIVPRALWTIGEPVTLSRGTAGIEILREDSHRNRVLAVDLAEKCDSIREDQNRLVRELDVLLNGEAGAADQASLCDIVAQVRMARKKPGTGALQLLALVPDQVVGRVHRIDGVADWPAPIYGVMNSLGRALPDNAPLYARPSDPQLRYVRVPSRKDPKYHEEWPEIEGGPVFDGVTYCNDLFEALKRYNVIAAETMPDGAV